MAKQNSLAISRARQKAEKLLQKKQLPAARAAYRQLCQLAPADHQAWLNLGLIDAALGDRPAAEKAFQHALALHHALPQAHANLARLATMRGDWHSAERHQRACLALQADNQRTYLELGVTLEQLNRLEESEALYRQALKLDAQRAELHIALGRVLRQQGRLDDAAAALQHALQLQPKTALAQLEMGNLRRAQKHYDAALEHYRQFITLAPQQRKTYLCSAAGILAEQERYQEALACFDEVLQHEPQAADIHFSRAQLLLGLGRFEEGWREYDWRLAYDSWQREDSFGYAHLRPLWQGEALAGKRVLIYAEQGYGDTLQFCRYLPLLAQSGARVHFHCRPELYALMKSIAANIEIEHIDINKVEKHAFDYYLPLMSLARFFSHDIHSIPAAIPYLHADAEKVRHWQQRLPQNQFKVGLVWAGSGANPRDKRRSLAPAQLAALSGLNGIAWYSLQKGATTQRLADAGVQLDITDLGAEINDFADTAAIIMNLDLVISVDTAVAHLAGALGRPLWILIYNGPDWRWLLERQDSPWYPTAKLFRQGVGEEWQGVVGRIAAALKNEKQGANSGA